MKMLRTLLGGVTLLGALLLVAGPASSDDKAKKGDAKVSPEIEAYIKASIPGPNHKRLDFLAGSFTYKLKMWMDPSQSTPTESSGTAQRKWILGNRYLQEDIHDQGQTFGQPFTGFGITGYDNIRKQYTSMWIDSMGTGITTSLGTVDASGKVITFHSEQLDPATGKPYKSRDVMRLVDANQHSVEMFKVGPDGQEMKVMEIHFTRKIK